MPTISACMIVRNEEQFLADCLRSIKNDVDEIVLVDTGSTDRTKQIAEEFGCVIYDFEWIDDFSAARNYGLERATKDWIFIIDADERLAKKGSLREVIDKTDADLIHIDVLNVYPDDPGAKTFLTSLRLWKREHDLCYEGIIHNYVAVPIGKFNTVKEPIRIIHLGYGLPPEQQQVKLDRTDRLLKKRLKENPDDAHGLMHMAQLHRVKDNRWNIAMAPQIYQWAIKAADLTKPRKYPDWHTHVNSLEIAGWAALHMGNYQQAVILANEAIAYKRNFLDALLLMGYAYMGLEQWDAAMAWFQRYCDEYRDYKIEDECDNIMVNQLEKKYAALDATGKCHEMKGNLDAAINHYMSALHLRPGDPSSFDSLNRLYTAGHLSEEEWKKALERQPKELAKQVDYYDRIYSEPYDTDRYGPIYDDIVSRVKKERGVLDAGCGVGSLTKMIADSGVECLGFDFSTKAIKQAVDRGARVEIGDLFNPRMYDNGFRYSCIVATEVMEHVDDFHFIRMLPKGIRLIASVPNFWDPAHVRRYRGPNSIADRFRGILKIAEIKEFSSGDQGQKIFLIDSSVMKGRGYGPQEEMDQGGNQAQGCVNESG